VTYAVQTPSSSTFASNQAEFPWAAIACVARLATGVAQLWSETLSGEPGRRLGTKHDTVGNGWVTDLKKDGWLGKGAVVLSRAGLVSLYSRVYFGVLPGSWMTVQAVENS